MRAVLTGLGAVVLVSAGAANRALAAPGSAIALMSVNHDHSNLIPSLKPAWVTNGFSAPEGAVRYNGDFYISNIAKTSESGGRSWISRVSATGKMLDQEWLSGLDAPKGMAIQGDIMMIADIDRLHLVRADTGDILDTQIIPGACFLNDVTVWQGDILISDSVQGRIYRIGAMGPNVWLEDTRLSGVNGLLGDGNRLLISTMTDGNLLEARPDGTLIQIATGLYNADGIGVVSGGYLISGSHGEVWFVAEDGQVNKLLNTSETPIQESDLPLLRNDQMIIPDVAPGVVTAWTIG